MKKKIKFFTNTPREYILVGILFGALLAIAAYQIGTGIAQ